MFFLFLFLLSVFPFIFPQQIYLNTSFHDEPVFNQNYVVWVELPVVLYEDIPKIIDIYESFKIGDCYLLAAFTSMAYQNPLWLMQNVEFVNTSNLIWIDNKGIVTNNYYITLFMNGEQVKIAVDDRILSMMYPPYNTMIASQARLLTSGKYSGSYVSWVQLFEKAFAKFNDRYRVIYTDLYGYEALAVGGWDEGLKAVTGGTSTTYNNENDGVPFNFSVFHENMEKIHNGSLIGFVFFSAPSNLRRDCSDGSFLVRYGTGQTSLALEASVINLENGTEYVVVTSHTYPVLDLLNGSVVIYNVWGVNVDTHGREIGPMMYIPETTLVCFSEYFVVCTSPEIVKEEKIVNNVTKGNGGNKNLNFGFLWINILILIIGTFMY
jgi:hypothetical protein